MTVTTSHNSNMTTLVVQQQQKSLQLLKPTPATVLGLLSTPSLQQHYRSSCSSSSLCSILQAAGQAANGRQPLLQ
jgi:hypothetical protein